MKQSFFLVMVVKLYIKKLNTYSSLFSELNL